MKKLLIFLFGFLFFFACSKEDAGTDTIYRKDGYAQIIDEEVTRYFEKTESDRLVLSAATPAAYIPSIGNILCGKITENTPDGFLGRVTRVDRGADGITVYTETVPWTKRSRIWKGIIGSIWMQASNPSSMAKESLSDSSIWTTIFGCNWIH